MTYQIADEPVETSLRAYVVRPSAPLLAIMVATGTDGMAVEAQQSLARARAPELGDRGVRRDGKDQARRRN